MLPRKFTKVVQEFQLRCKIEICNKHFLIKIQRREKCPIKAVRNSGSGGVHNCIYPCNCTACESLPVKQGQYFLILKNKTEQQFQNTREFCAKQLVPARCLWQICEFWSYAFLRRGGKWKFSEQVKLFLSEKYLHFVQTTILSSFSLIPE